MDASERMRRWVAFHGVGVGVESAVRLPNAHAHGRVNLEQAEQNVDQVLRREEVGSQIPSSRSDQAGGQSYYETACRNKRWSRVDLASRLLT